MSRLLSLVAVALAAVACSSPAREGKAPPPAKVANPVPEADLGKVTLTPEAEARLAVRTAAVEERELARVRRVGGEVIAPPGRALTVSAPLAGTLLPPDGAPPPTAGAPLRKGQVVLRLRPLPAGDLGSAQARLAAARAKARRTEQLLAAGATSQRALEEALAELAAAESAARAVAPATDEGGGDVLVLTSPQDGVLSALHVAAGQSVAAATPLFDIAPRTGLWVRVPVYAGDRAGIDATKGAVVHALSEPAGSPGRRATAIAGPPTADPLAATTDVFFETPNADGALRPGERVQVELRLREPERVQVVPWSAIVYDFSGAAWVYENTAEHVFVRRRVDVRRVEGELAVLAGGPAPGARVVSVGAAELFGTELGTGK